MIPLGPVVARSRVGVARAAAWTYLVEPDRRAEWWPELQLEARVGGAVAEQWSEGEGDAAVSRDASGTIDVWVDGHAVGFTWREAGDERDTAVLITLRTQGLDTGITVTETGFDALPAASERAAASQEGWQVLLRDLTSALEAAQAAGVFGERETPAAGGEAAEGGAGAAAGVGAAAGAGAAGALEVAAPELDGELDDGDVDGAPESPSAATDGQAEIELEAEPAVGDLPELETGPVAVVPTDDAEGQPIERPAEVVADDPEELVPEQDLDQTLQIDRSELPDASGSGRTDQSDEPEQADEPDETDEPDEPDFDTLIRGN